MSQVEYKCNHKYPYVREEKGDLAIEVGAVRMETRGWSHAGKGQEPGNRQPPEASEVEKVRSALRPPERPAGPRPWLSPSAFGLLAS